jgi:hypothetical protein
MMTGLWQPQIALVEMPTDRLLATGTSALRF